MSALNDLVRKFKEAVTGVEDAPRNAKPADWEPARAAAAPATAVVEEESPREAASPSGGPGPQGWKRASAEPSSVVGATIPADVADFATVYKGAVVEVPSHGYGVDRVAGMLANKSLAGLDKTVKASAVLAGLDAAGVSIDDVIHDALLRYKALVAFEAAKELELHQVRIRSERRIAELKSASEAFQKEKQAEVDGLRRESATAAASLTRLQTRQRAEEDRFHHTVSLFVEPLPARIVPMTPSPAEAPAARAAAEAPNPTVVSAVAPAQEAPAPAAEPANEEAKS